MGRGPCRFTEADVRRAIKAAKRAGASVVEIKPDGTIAVSLSPQTTEDAEIEAGKLKDLVP